jgi:hypothetical protein
MLYTIILLIYNFINIMIINNLLMFKVLNKFYNNKTYNKFTTILMIPVYKYKHNTVKYLRYNICIYII